LQEDKVPNDNNPMQKLSLVDLINQSINQSNNQSINQSKLLHKVETAGQHFPVQS
jgi:hypothetical protein